MNIAKLSGSNFRGGSFSYELAPVTVIYGDNAAGKTRILAAARTVLLGYDPDLGKKKMNEGMQDGEVKELEGTMSSGQVYSHRWQKKDGSVSHANAGPDVAVPVELLDLSEYLYETTAAERVKMVFDKLRLDEFDDAALIESIHKIEALPMQVALPIVTELERDVANSIVDRVKFNIQIQVWLEKQIQKLRDRRKAANDGAKAATATVLALKARSNSPAARDVSAELAKVKEARRKADTNYEIWRARQDDWNKAAKRREQIQTELKGIDEAMMARPLPELAQALSEKRERLKLYQSDTEALRLLEGKLKTRLEVQGQNMNSQKVAISNLDKEIAGVKAEGFCAKCEQKVLAGREKSAQHLRNALASMEEDRKEIEAKRKATAAKLKRADEEDTAHAQAVVEAHELETIYALRLELRNLGGSVRPDEKQGQQLYEQVQAFDVRLSGLEKDQAAYLAMQDLTQRRNAAETDAVRGAVAVNVLDQALKILLTAQGKVVADAFEGLLEDARLFTDGILRSPLTYREGELGRYEGETFVSHEAFSGTEKLLAYAGLSYALAAQSPIKIVLLDEMARLTRANKTAVMERLLSLVQSGLLDQALCVDTTAEDYKAFEKQVRFIEVK